MPQIAHVVTSDRGVESAARAARTTYVVTAAQIARDGDRTVADAIEAVPGVNIVRYGAFGAAATVGIRGSSAQQILILVDGLPMAGGEIDDINLEQFSVSGVDRIEVVEGGGSTLYGSGSIGGVINIITANPATQTNATVATGSFDEQTYLFQTPFLTFQRTYAANDYSVINAPNRQNAQAGLTSVTARYAHAVGAVQLHHQRRFGRRRIAAFRASSIFFRRPANRTTSIATYGSARNTKARAPRRRSTSAIRRKSSPTRATRRSIILSELAIRRRARA